MSALGESLRALGAGRLAAMGAVAVVLSALLAVLAGHGGGGGRLALLYADLDAREAAQIAERLDAQHIAREVSAAGDRVMVPEAEVSRARLLLAREGLPSGGSIGYEIFDRGDALTTSSFQQQINQTRALEGELSRTIRAISGVRAARVHLVLPKREPFAREQQEAQASVLLTMAGANRLDHEGVQAVVNLVAAAVPGLRPKNVAVIDSRGDVLARAGVPADAADGALGPEEMRRAAELRLARAVEDMLERTVGAGRVRAEASVDLDFAQLHETQEKFDPEGQVPRSTQSVTDSSKTTEPGTTVSVQNNLPNADAGGAPGAGTQTQRQEETTNYEVGKTVRTLVREQPEIRRISLAVLVDGRTEPGPDGRPLWQPRPADELDRLAALVRGAIGYDEKRGDHVEVVNLRFASDDAPSGGEPRRLLGLPLDGPEVTGLARTGVFALVAILGLLLVLRPMVRRLTGPSEAMALAPPLDAAEGGVLAGTGEPVRLLAGPPGSAPGAASGPASGPAPGAATGMAPGMALARVGASGAAAAGDDDGMIELANIQGQMRASSIRRIADLVDRHPEESLSIVRAWMQQEPA